MFPRDYDIEKNNLKLRPEGWGFPERYRFFGQSVPCGHVPVNIRRRRMEPVCTTLEGALEKAIENERHSIGSIDTP